MRLCYRVKNYVIGCIARNLVYGADSAWFERVIYVLKKFECIICTGRFKYTDSEIKCPIKEEYNKRKRSVGKIYYEKHLKKILKTTFND